MIILFHEVFFFLRNRTILLLVSRKNTILPGDIVFVLSNYVEFVNTKHFVFCVQNIFLQETTLFLRSHFWDDNHTWHFSCANGTCIQHFEYCKKVKNVNSFFVIVELKSLKFFYRLKSYVHWFLLEIFPSHCWERVRTCWAFFRFILCLAWGNFVFFFLGIVFVKIQFDYRRKV